MKDKISQSRLDKLHPKVKVDFKSFIEDAEEGLNITLRIAQGIRTMAEQQAIYDKGRKTSGPIVTNAKPGSSYHNYGLAIDLVRLDGDKVDWNYDMAHLLPYANRHNIVWGGSWKSFKDKPHFEKTFGYNWKTLLDKHNKKDFISNTEFVIL